MTISAITEMNWSGLAFVKVEAASCRFSETGETRQDAASTTTQIERLSAAFGISSGGLPRVDEESLARYCAHLSANLSGPFMAHYPVPKNIEEEIEFCGEVVELLDPATGMCDEIDGLFCKFRKGRFEVNLPLVELHLPKESPNFQLIEDFAYWFANWR